MLSIVKPFNSLLKVIFLAHQYFLFFKNSEINFTFIFELEDKETRGERARPHHQPNQNKPPPAPRRRRPIITQFFVGV